MGEQFLDDLARGLDEGTISRRRALKLAGGALLGAVVPSLFPREAEALSARKRCHRKGGIFLPSEDPTSPCHCTSKDCANRGLHCHNNSDCYCWKTIDGTGFCGKAFAVRNYCSSAQPCPAGSTCIVVSTFCCGNSPCTTNTDCTAGACGTCVNGNCQVTGCFEACPT